jgi:hypothetical protein
MKYMKECLLILPYINSKAVIVFDGEIEMKTDIILSVVAATVFVALFGMLFGTLSYEEKMRVECRMSAMQKGYTAIEIQAVCK